MMASVSSAAGESRRGRSANWARSMASAYSRRVRNCHPWAISTSSTPWSAAAKPSRSSASAAWTAASPAVGSRVRSSSTVSGRDDANSAASNSFARGLTADLDRGEGSLLVHAQGPTLGELQESDEHGEHVDECGTRAHDVQPAELRALDEQRLQLRGRPLHIERPGYDAVQHRLRDERDHPLRRGQEVVQLDDERRRRGGRRLGTEPAPQLLGAPGRRLAQPLDQLADLLVLEQPPHQLGPRIFPLVVSQPPRQQHLRLDPQEPRRHLEVVRRLVQPQLVDHREELIGDLRDRQVGDVELVLVNQVQQQIQGARELLQLDDEAGLVLHDGTPRRAHEGNAPGERAKPPTSARPTLMSWVAGHSSTCSAPGNTQMSNTTGMKPSACSWRYLRPAPGGSK